MSEMNYVKQETFEQMKHELHHLKSVERPAASKAIAEAREKGDLKELEKWLVQRALVYLRHPHWKYHACKTALCAAHHGHLPPCTRHGQQIGWLSWLNWSWVNSTLNRAHRQATREMILN